MGARAAIRTRASHAAPPLPRTRASHAALQLALVLTLCDTSIIAAGSGLGTGTAAARSGVTVSGGEDVNHAGGTTPGVLSLLRDMLAQAGRGPVVARSSAPPTKLALSGLTVQGLERPLCAVDVAYTYNDGWCRNVYTCPVRFSGGKFKYQARVAHGATSVTVKTGPPLDAGYIVTINGKSGASQRVPIATNGTTINITLSYTGGDENSTVPSANYTVAVTRATLGLQTLLVNPGVCRANTGASTGPAADSANPPQGTGECPSPGTQSNFTWCTKPGESPTVRIRACADDHTATVVVPPSVTAHIGNATSQANWQPLQPKLTDQKKSYVVVVKSATGDKKPYAVQLTQARDFQLSNFEVAYKGGAAKAASAWRAAVQPKFNPSNTFYKVVKVPLHAKLLLQLNSTVPEARISMSVDNSRSYTSYTGVALFPFTLTRDRDSNVHVRVCAAVNGSCLKPQPYKTYEITITAKDDIYSNSSKFWTQVWGCRVQPPMPSGPCGLFWAIMGVVALGGVGSICWVRRRRRRRYSEARVIDHRPLFRD